ncbi:MAG: glycosyltransferase family 39 protein [Cyanobium sp. PLM2.Bin73]|nr:MAG: glycosyltransferase family 39 protein [Cyanobium sp. PLM2.Bin73]
MSDRRRTALARPLLLLLLCLALYLPGLASLPLTDRDEARYVQATRQMLASGDLLDIRFQDSPRHKKPAGIYWLQALSAGAAQRAGAPATAMAPFRLVSVLGATTAVLLLYGLFAPLIGAEQAFLAGLLLAGSLLLGIEAHLAKTDATLLAAVVAMQGGLARVVVGAERGGEAAGERAGWGSRALFWGGLGVGMLIKGPVAPAVAGLTLAALMGQQRSWRPLLALRPWPWLLLTLALVGPWLLAIQTVSQGGFLQESLGRDFLPKLIEGQESHGAPPGTYTLLAPLLLWPVSWLLLPAAWLGWRRHRHQPPGPKAAVGRVALAWLLPAWLVFELVPTKLPQYVLPLVPALCLLAAAGFSDLPARDRWGRRLSWLVGALWALGGVALALAAPIASVWALGRVSVAAALVSVVCLALLMGAPRRPPPQRLALSLAAAVLVWGLLFQAVIPSLEPLWPAPRLAALLQREGADAQPIALAGFREPSAVFLLGTDTLLTNLDGVAQHLDRHGEAVAILPTAALAELEALSPTAASRERRLLGRVRGLNISKGRPLDLTVLEQRCLPTPSTDRPTPVSSAPPARGC